MRHRVTQFALAGVVLANAAFPVVAQVEPTRSILESWPEPKSGDDGASLRSVLESNQRPASPPVATPAAADSSSELLPAPKPLPSSEAEPGRSDRSPALGSDMRAERSPPINLATLPTRDGYELLLQGPVHEAFASPSDVEAQRSVPVIESRPPPPLREQRPELERAQLRLAETANLDFQWMPGYWAWLDEAQQYAWISGFYRAAPPGRTWAPGQWTETTGGFRWTSGYWAESEFAASPSYLPPPPKAIAVGPSKPAPQADSFWLPGHWSYVDGDYTWEDGYWTNQPEQWIWQPATYVNTPDGYVYVSGYWDYEPQHRGLPYAPVLVNNRSQGVVTYQPAVPLAQQATILLHLFVRAGYRCYFYGDYYSAEYLELGYRPWYAAPRGVAWEAAPLLSFYEWQFGRQNVNLVQSLRRYEQLYRSDVALRPANQLATNPRLILQSGLAALTADSLEQIVLNPNPAVTFANSQRAAQANSGRRPPEAALNPPAAGGGNLAGNRRPTVGQRSLQNDRTSTPQASARPNLADSRPLQTRPQAEFLGNPAAVPGRDSAFQNPLDALRAQMRSVPGSPFAGPPPGLVIPIPPRGIVGPPLPFRGGGLTGRPGRRR